MSFVKTYEISVTVTKITSRIGVSCTHSLLFFINIINDLQTYTQDTNMNYKTKKIYLVWLELLKFIRRK